MAEYKQLDINKFLSFGKISTKTYEEALSDKEPLVYTKTMFDSNGVLKAKNVHGDVKDKCVKLEISY